MRRTGEGNNEEMQREEDWRQRDRERDRNGVRD